MNTFDAGSIIYELARGDASISTYVIVQSALGMKSIEQLGSEE